MKKLDYLHDLPHIRDGLDHLLKHDRVFSKSGISLDDFAWPYTRPGFSGLVRIVVGQQVSTGAARALWQRFTDTLGRVTPAKILALSDDDFRALGMSRQKTIYIRGLALAASEGRLNLTKIGKLDDVGVYEAITAHKGMGPWSAQMYLMFSLGRPDVWPHGDLGIQEGMKRYLKRKERPDAAQVLKMGKRFAPHRTAASLLLWRSLANGS